MASDTEALLQFKNSVEPTTAITVLTTWRPDTVPCQTDLPWVGVICYEATVNSLRLHSLGLSRKIRTTALATVPGLRTLSLNSNNFTGPMPEFNKIPALKALFISNNQFSCEIPRDYFAKMGSLKKLYIDNNEFSGELPESLVNLKNLLELHVENNQFIGKIPQLKQPPLLNLNVSNNRLAGEIPIGISNLGSSSFDGNPGFCGEILERDCGDSSSKKRDSIALTAVASVIVVVVMVSILICRRKQENREFESSSSIIWTESFKSSGRVEGSVAAGLSRRWPSRKGGSTHGGGGAGIGELVVVNEKKGVFKMADLMKAAVEVMGSGGMGAAYKAALGSGVTVVVKRTREMNCLERAAFDGKMRQLAGVRHRNVLPPVAYHFRKEEYVSKGSLLSLLHGARGTSHAMLNWPTRFKIIFELAQGLAYLHTR